MKVMMRGGYNYGEPTEDDAENFTSIREACIEWRSRRDIGFYHKGSNGFLHPNWGDGITGEDVAMWIKKGTEWVPYSHRERRQR